MERKQSGSNAVSLSSVSRLVNACAESACRAAATNENVAVCHEPHSNRLASPPRAIKVSGRERAMRCQEMGMHMKTTFGIAITALALGGAAIFTTSAMAAKDDFDRTTLGKKWVVTSGNLYINNDQLQGDLLSLGYYKKSSNDTSVSAVMTITNSAETEYGAVASGDIAGGDNAFVKLQTQDGDGMFEYGGFYTGNNGGGDFFALDTPVPSPATLSVSFCGTIAQMTIKSSAGKQKYTYDYGATFGTGGGLGTYGAIAIDDYRSKAGGCKLDRDARMIKGSTAKDLSLSK
jgi:hypothetical protein